MPSKRKRSGPGVSHRDDAGNSSSRARYESHAGSKGKQLYRVPFKSISGPGILVSCVQGRERKAALQFMDLLNETADRIYPGVMPEPITRRGKDVQEAKGGVEVEDEMDALRNGPTLNQQPPPPPPLESTSETPGLSPPKQSEDIEAQIASELQHIKASERRRGPQPSGTQDRFRKVETDTECLVFISVSPPFDPLTLVTTILDRVAETGEPGTRFVQRLSPVSQTCRADFNSLLEHAQTVLPRFFLPQGPPRTFKIDPRIRSHSTLHRSDVIAAIAQAIPTGAENTKLHTANLDNPDLWIVVEILKNVAAISVLAHYDRYKKYNLQSVADAANQLKAAAIHSTSNDAAGKQSAPAEQGRIAQSLAPSLASEATAPQHRHDDTQHTSPSSPPPSTTKDTSSDPIAGFKLF